MADFVYFNRQITADIECADQYELLNWTCLTGAVYESDGKPEFVVRVEADVLRSNKCFTTFES